MSTESFVPIQRTSLILWKLPKWDSRATNKVPCRPGMSSALLCVTPVMGVHRDQLPTHWVKSLLITPAAADVALVISCGGKWDHVKLLPHDFRMLMRGTGFERKIERTWLSEAAPSADKTDTWWYTLALLPAPSGDRTLGAIVSLLIHKMVLLAPISFYLFI